jgi:CRISPR-associated protein Cmr4
MRFDAHEQHMHKLIFLITRTPLHIGAGSTEGAIDQPVLRERHTGFPIIPGSTLKGIFARAWTDPASGVRLDEGIALFGNNQPGKTTPAMIQFTEAKLLAFPVRSARGSFAWITCPLILQRLARDGGLPKNLLPAPSLRDDQALFQRSSPITLAWGAETKVVLEDYTFSHAGDLPVAGAPTPGQAQAASPSQSFGDHFRNWVQSDPVWQEAGHRLVVINDGLMTFFTRQACEVVQHLMIDNATGSASPESIYSQENVPAETLFYATAHDLRRRNAGVNAPEATSELDALAVRLHRQVFQFGGDASTGLGFCTVEIENERE